MKKFNWFEFTMSHHWAYNLDWWWRHGWISSVRYFVHNALNDPYKKERECLPRYSWRDRDQVMEDVVFKLFEEYCDSEDKNWNRKWTIEGLYGQPIKEGDSMYQEMVEYRDGHNKKVDKMVEIYSFIKNRKQKWEEAFNSVDMKLENEMSELDTKYLIEIVKLKGVMWT